MSLKKFLMLYAIGISAIKGVYIQYRDSNIIGELSSSVIYDPNSLPDNYKAFKVSSFYVTDDNNIRVIVHD